MSSLTATFLVLNTPELIEPILLHTDQRTLLVACNRVNNKWRDVINTTPPMKRHLFFEPYQPSASELLVVLGCKNRYLLNPLLDWGFSSWFKDQEDKGTGADSDQSSLLHFTTLPWEGSLAAWKRKDASWRRMQITQPPVQELGVREECMEYGGRTVFRVGFLSFPLGAPLTMGRLYDSVRKETLHESYRSSSGEYGYKRRAFTLQVWTLLHDGNATLWLSLSSRSNCTLCDTVPIFVSEACEKQLEPSLGDWGV